MCDEYDTKVSKKAFIQIKIFIIIYLFKGHLAQKRKEEEEEEERKKRKGTEGKGRKGKSKKES